MNKIINSKCACGIKLSEEKIDNVILIPCEHIIHFSCLNLIKNNKCPVCKNIATTMYTYNDIQGIWRKTKDKQFYQRYIDMASIKYVWNMGNTDPFRMLFNFPSLSVNIIKLMYCNKKNEAENIINNLLNLANIYIKINGKEKIRNIPKIIIANHTMELDAIIIHKIFNSSFVASSIAKDNFIGRKLISLAPVITINRGKSKNTVQKIKKYMDKHKTSVCLFPEGLCTHPKTIIRFRTGAFNTGYPVQPVVIRYEPNIMDDNIATLFTKLFSQEKIIVTVDVLDIEYPPFTKEKIEHIRQKMGIVGNMAISRVSSRDIID